MVMVKATKNSEAGVMPDEKLLADMGKFNEELMMAGVMLEGEGLHPSSRGTRVIFSGGKKTVVDGPFAETKEALGGFYLIDCENKERAIELASQIPDSAIEGLGVEVRQVMFADGQLEA